ncbi:MAG: hypothetical protein JW923_01250 [Spirochaetales bacterium]|nr:hypothetical protein [Spirochaetales bacterium]MBP7263406.1 hypothetical protein [Spirochaetia bacterium]
MERDEICTHLQQVISEPGIQDQVQRLFPKNLKPRKKPAGLEDADSRLAKLMRELDH